MTDEIEDERSYLSNDVESWAKTKINRRKALSSAAKAAIGAAAVIIVGGVAYYAYQASRAPPPTTVAPSTVTVTASPSTTTVTTTTVTTTVETSPTVTRPTTIISGGTPLYFNVWAWHPEVVKENLDIFNQQYGENAELIVNPGDYYATLETKLFSRSKIDLFYVHGDWMTRWYKAGWIEPTDNEEHFDEILKDTRNPNLIKHVTMPDGKHVGWIYWYGTKPLEYNGRVLKEAGLAGDDGHIIDPPKTWDDLLNMCVEIKKKGIVDYPFLAGWNQGWFAINQTFHEYCISEGELLLDPETQEPTFDVDTPAMDVLEFMREAMELELVPKGVLAMGELEQITAFATGKYAFSDQIDYDIQNHNNPEKSPDAGWFHYTPRMPGKTGWPLLVPAMYSITNHSYMGRSPNDALRVERLHEFYSWKDKNGEYLTQKKWISEFLLGQAFTPLYELPETKQGWLRFMDEKDMEYKKNADMIGVAPPGYSGVLWYSKLQLRMIDLLPKMVLGEISTKETIADLRKTAEDQIKEFGGIEIWK